MLCRRAGTMASDGWCAWLYRLLSPGSAAPPCALTFASELVKSGAKTITSLALQLPPREFGASATVATGPPVAAIFIKFAAGKESDASGRRATRKDAKRPRCLQAACAESLFSERTHSSLVSPECATKAILSPCGERTGMPPDVAGAVEREFIWRRDFGVQRELRLGGFRPPVSGESGQGDESEQKCGRPSAHDFLECAKLTLRIRCGAESTTQRRSIATSCADWKRSAGSLARQARTTRSSIGRRERLAGADGIRIFFQNRAEYAELRFAFEGAAAGDHFVENASEAEQIAARVGFRSLQNFRGHVLESSDDRTFLRERRRRRGERCQVHRRRGRSEAGRWPASAIRANSGFARPKSISFAPALVSMMFAGFRSRWMMPC